MDPTPQPDRRYAQLLAKIGVFAVGAAVVLAVLYPIRQVLLVLLSSLLIAYVLDPVVDRFEARRVPRSVAIVALMAAGFAFVFGFALWVLPPLAQEVAAAGERLRAWLGQDSSALAERLQAWTGFDLTGPLAQAKQELATHAPELLRKGASLLTAALADAMGAVSGALAFLMVPLFVFYFLRDFDRMTGWVAANLPARLRDGVLERAERFHAIVGAWLSGQVQVALALAVIYALGLALVGIRLGVAIGILAGLLSVVPYLGFAVGFGLAATMALVSSAGWWPLAGVAAVFTVAQILEGYVLTPRIVGEKVGLSPVVTLIALFVGGEALGILGLLLAVPVAGMLRVVIDEVLDAYRHSTTFRGPAAPEGPAGPPVPTAASAPPPDGGAPPAGAP